MEEISAARVVVSIATICAYIHGIVAGRWGGCSGCPCFTRRLRSTGFLELRVVESLSSGDIGHGYMSMLHYIATFGLYFGFLLRRMASSFIASRGYTVQ